MTVTIDVQRAVMRSDLPAPTRHLVLTLAALADFTTGVIPDQHCPSLSDLADMTGLSRASVAAHLKVADESGWIGRDSPDAAAARRGATTKYWVMVGGPTTVPEKPRKGSPGDGLVHEMDHVGSPGDRPPVVQEMDQGSPGAGRNKRKTPTGSTTSSTSRTNQRQPRTRTRKPTPTGHRPPHRDAEPPPSDAEPTRTEQLLTEYRDDSPRGVPSRQAERLAAEIHTLIGDGYTDDEIRAALGQLRVRRLGPAMLPGLVDELANQARAAPGTVVPFARAAPGAPRPSTTDQRVAAGLALAAKYDAIQQFNATARPAIGGQE